MCWIFPTSLVLHFRNSRTISMDDANVYLLHRARSDLKRPGSRARVTGELTCFRTFRPLLPAEKLSAMQVRWGDGPHRRLPKNLALHLSDHLLHLWLQLQPWNVPVQEVLWGVLHRGLLQWGRGRVPKCGWEVRQKVWVELHPNIGQTKERLTDFQKSRNRPTLITVYLL